MYKRQAKDFNIKLGDIFTLNIYGREVDGEIVNFRKVDYRDLNINFAMLINPSFAKKLPSEILATVKFDKEVIPYYDIAAICIESVEIKGEKVEDISEEEKIEFIETLTPPEFEKITEFFASMPVVQNVIEFECGNCGAENESIMNGFFGETE